MCSIYIIFSVFFNKFSNFRNILPNVLLFTEAAIIWKYFIYYFSIHSTYSKWNIYNLALFCIVINETIAYSILLGKLFWENISILMRLSIPISLYILNKITSLTKRMLRKFLTWWIPFPIPYHRKLVFSTYSNCVIFMIKRQIYTSHNWRDSCWNCNGFPWINHWLKFTTWFLSLEL